MNMKPTARTGNYAPAFEHAEDFHLEFFSKAGSLFEKKGSYYGNESTALELFKNSWRVGDYETSMKLLFWLRDIRRGGAGNRSGFRSILTWLASDPVGQAWLKVNLDSIPELGRWDDLKAFYDTKLEKKALTLWAKAIKSGDQLAAKWAGRQDSKLRSHMKLTPKNYRKLLVKNTKVVEQLMCAKNWREIKYEHVPSVAIGRYNKAFFRNDLDRYNAYRQGLVKVKKDGSVELTGEVKAGAIYPHDLIRTVHAETHGAGYWSRRATVSDETKKLVEAQFLSMPDFFDTTKRRILPFLDFSSSMFCNISGSIQAIDVALGLGMYCSDRIGKNNPFYRKVIPFSSSAKFESWENMLFADAALSLPAEGYCGSTNINAAFDLVLNSAKMFQVEKSKMPNVILIISDQQFDHSFNDSQTPVTTALNKWVKAGYKKPEIIYWNLMGYKNTPATKYDKNIGMVSGFSPAILKSVLEGGKFDPLSIMKRTIDQYEVKVP